MKCSFFLIVLLFFLINNVYSSDTKIIILGFDGLDPKLVAEFINEGILPNLKQLKNNGYYNELISSNPPQSPVAWSNFITGQNSGGHNIFDFIHRKPETYMPVFAMSEIVKTSLQIWKFKLPFETKIPKLLRQGKAFWEILDENNIKSTIFKIPSNYPPVPGKSKTISGMGTPDILGTYGIFSYYTNKRTDDLKKIDDGANLKIVNINDNIIETTIDGPPGEFFKDNEPLQIPLTIYIDKFNDVVRLQVQDKNILLYKGEWSDWIRIKFRQVPYFSEFTAICRFLLKQAHPDFKLYLSPLNIDPVEPVSNISTPDKYAKELADKIGLFYTQGMPEETKGLSSGALTDDEYVEQALYILENRIKIFDYEFSRFNKGVLFYYFSSSDLNLHMLYRFLDKNNPLYKKEETEKFKKIIKTIYIKLDKVVGKVIKYVNKNPNTVLFILSDHGFSPFNRKFNLNTWLVKKGYMKLYSDENQIEFFNNVDWQKTRAYGVGFNALYINQIDREAEGVVDISDKDELLNEIKNKLLRLYDDKTGLKIINNIYESEKIYNGPFVSNAPDLIVGYSRGYRVSDKSALGTIENDEIIEDNLSKWSGDHCMDYKLLNGVVFSNKKIFKKNPALVDFFPTILCLYNIPVPDNVIGINLFIKQ